MQSNNAVGRYGEDLAVAHLQAEGLQILDRNWRCRLGEIDVVAREGDCLVVCEVKTRRSIVSGGPFEAVTPIKLGRLRRLTAVWLSEQTGHYAQIRIDVIGVLRSKPGQTVIDHLKGVS